MSLKFVVNESIRSLDERLLSTLFDIDGCNGGREDELGEIMGEKYYEEWVSRVRIMMKYLGLRG